MTEVIGSCENIPDGISNLMIPERRFWTEDAQRDFLDDNGQLKRDFTPLDKPLLDKDKYDQIVDIPAFMAQLRSLFIPGHTFPKAHIRELRQKLEENKYYPTDKQLAIINLNDNIDHVQQQKLYAKMDVDDDRRRLCYLPERQAVLPYRAHVTLTALYNDLDAIDPHVGRDHRVGAHLCSKMFESAVIHEQRDNGLNLRKQSLKNGRITPGTPIINGCDVLSNEYFRSMSKAIGEVYKATLWLFLSDMPEESYFARFVEPVSTATPREIIDILGTVTTSTPWRYSRYLRGGVELNDSLQAHSDHQAQRVIDDSRLVL